MLHIEVIILENQEHLEQQPEQEQPEQLRSEGYKPRPKWQIWAARVGLVIFIAFLIVYYLIYFRGGR